MQTTNLNVTTVAIPLLSSATTWANSKGASLYDPVTLNLRNSGVTIVRVGSSLLTSATGFPVSSNTTFSIQVKAKGEGLFVVTSASTSNIDVMADRQ